MQKRPEAYYPCLAERMAAVSAAILATASATFDASKPARLPSYRFAVLLISYIPWPAS